VEERKALVKSQKRILADNEPWIAEHAKSKRCGGIKIKRH
jgi:hypothetical protein